MSSGTPRLISRTMPACGTPSAMAAAVGRQGRVATPSRFRRAPSTSPPPPLPPSLPRTPSESPTRRMTTQGSASALNQSISGPAPPSTASSEQLRLYFRVRPRQAEEQAADLSLAAGQATLKLPGGKTKAVACDGVFEADATQQQVYERLGAPAVEALLSGYNGTIFAYGQTGSGKTHAMIGGKDQDAGLIPRIIQSVYDQISVRRQSQPNCEYRVFVEAVELYCEQLRDLITPSKSNLEIQVTNTRAAGRKNVSVPNLTRERVESCDAALKLLEKGQKNRNTSATAMNEASSRSHAIYMLTVEMEDTVQMTLQTAKLNLVDLAGSESQRAVHTTGQTREEGNKINLSLSTLSLVIQELQEGTKALPSYRSSKLTLLLSDSLGGNCKTQLLATLNPSVAHVLDSLSTMNFAERARCIKLTAQRNQQRVGEGALASELAAVRRENISLRAELENLRSASMPLFGFPELPSEEEEQAAQEQRRLFEHSQKEWFEESDRRTAELQELVQKLEGMAEVKALNETQAQEIADLRAQLQQQQQQQLRQQQEQQQQTTIAGGSHRESRCSVIPSLDCSSVTNLTFSQFATAPGDLQANLRAAREAEDHEALLKAMNRAAALKKDKKELEQKLSALQADFEQKLSSLQSELEQERARALAEQEQKSFAIQALAAVDKEKMDLGMQLSQVKQVMAAQLEDLARMEEAKLELEREMDERQQIVQDKDAAYESLEEQHADLVRRQEDWTLERESLLQQVSFLTSENASLSARSRASLSPSKVQLMKGQIVDLQMQLEESERALQAAQQQLAEERQLVKFLEERQANFDSVEALVQLQQTEISDLTAQLSSANDQALQARRDANVNLQAREQEIAVLLNEHCRLVEQGRENEQRMAQAQERLEECEAQLVTMKAAAALKSASEQNVNESVMLNSSIAIERPSTGRASLNRSTSAPLPDGMLASLAAQTATPSVAPLAKKIQEQLKARKLKQQQLQAEAAAALQSVPAPVAAPKSPAYQVPIALSSPSRPRRTFSSVLQSVERNANTAFASPRKSSALTDFIEAAKGNSAEKQKKRSLLPPPAMPSPADGSENAVPLSSLGSPRRYATAKLSLCPQLEGEKLADKEPAHRAGTERRYHTRSSTHAAGMRL